jgi:excisionase family DNA binding protein
MEDELFTVDEAASQLKIHSGTLRKMLRDGSIRGMKFGAREWRVPASALREFVESKMQKPDAPRAD